MRKLSSIAAVVVLVVALTATPVAAGARPWPRGEVNPFAKCVTLEYGQSLFGRPVVKGFPTGGYADVWIGSDYQRVSTAAAANALLMASQTANAEVRVSVPYRDVDASGRLFVRHGLSVDPLARTSDGLVVSGDVSPSSPHDVEVSVKRHLFGMWLPTKTFTVKSGDGGAFSSTLPSSLKEGTYEVSVHVDADAQNAAKTVFASHSRPRPENGNQHIPPRRAYGGCGR